ncbi:hypothetical protein MGYG_08742 [Nannizzia gypsea CBS 118893]|uniref:Uncharacterized protein n=1 Tax=Arthroderma gypseum (strain ATCC MYA-4604 / CBS 118893) TaxID=535722 RepID=E4V6V3_ARTGP|nr:hypothetical protein MGYG_08742 [Nannizzia gypsea CBS 118893]EFQ96819.1 hypothetical protein MGYG_08742 [Nannizzia gypsea CBS 118893]
MSLVPSNSGSEPDTNRTNSNNNQRSASTVPDDGGAAATAELEAAIVANPDLRPVTPQFAEWEDYDTILAQNPDIANPVPGRKKEFYLSKDRWECGHEEEPVQTAIERNVSEGGGSNAEPAILINDIRGICEACMAKWRRLETAGPQPDAPGPSSATATPRGLPLYTPSWERPGVNSGPPLELDDSDDEFDDDGTLSDGSEDSLGPPPGPPPGSTAGGMGAARSR